MSSFAATIQPLSLTVRYDQSVPVLVIPEGLAFEPLRSWLRNTLPSQLDAIGGRTSRLDFGSRPIVLFDLRRLVNFLKQEFDLEITGLYVLPDVVHRFAERELKLKLFSASPFEAEALAGPIEDADTEEISEISSEISGPPVLVTPPQLATPTATPFKNKLALHQRTPGTDTFSDQPVHAVAPARSVPPPQEQPAVGDSAIERSSRELLRKVRLPHDLDPADLTPVPSPAMDDGSRRTLPIHRTLRSGTQIRFDGDIHVYGDVNPGAQLVATGSIMVLGTLKGVAHAGAHGDEKAFILAFDMRATQLRIARNIAIPPRRPSPGGVLPEIATVVDQQVKIARYKGRIPT